MAKLGRSRATAVLLVVLVGVLGLGIRLAQVQGFSAGHYADIARKQRLRTIVLPATRGAIYDRNGRELALSTPARTIYANPKQIKDPDGTARVLAPLLNADPGDLVSKLSRKKGFVYLARQIDVATANKIASLRLIGVGVIDESRRGYPGVQLASNVVGFVGTDGTGLAGIEHAFDKLLGGRAGSRELEQDPQGRAIPQGMYRETPPVAGGDLELTLDRDIQYAAEHSLQAAIDATGAKGGTVIVMRPGTGEILAMASAPTFDPNDPRNIDMHDTRNRAVVDAYEPGSANKVVTAAAALESGVVTPQSTFTVPAQIQLAGTTFHDAHGHATKSMTFQDIIAQSSNVGTIQVALRLGAQKLGEYLHKFGYGRTTALGFPGESAGLLPSTSRYKTSLPTMAIGQGLSVTALQIARVYATVANGGVAVEPRLVAGWVDQGGQYHAAPASRSERVIRPETAATLRDMLSRVVTDGTGTAAAIPGYAVAGKTGTAQKPGPHGGYQGYMASFMGMVPLPAPELVIGAVLDDPTPIYGGVVSAPIFREVGQAALRILRVPPSTDLNAANDAAAKAERKAAALAAAKPTPAAKPAPAAKATPASKQQQATPPSTTKQKTPVVAAPRPAGNVANSGY